MLCNYVLYTISTYSKVIMRKLKHQLSLITSYYLLLSTQDYLSHTLHIILLVFSLLY